MDKDDTLHQAMLDALAHLLSHGLDDSEILGILDEDDTQTLTGDNIR